MAWVNFENGEAGGSIRSKINTFLTTVDDFLFGNNKYTDTEVAKVAANTAAVAELIAPESTKYTPLAVAPTYQEGQVYYDQGHGTLKVQGPIEGSGIEVGHSMHVHVINNTGATIEKGMAVRHDGVAAGKIQVAKAIATSFDNARLFGVAQDDILNGQEGAIMTFGEITNLNTLGYPTGVPLYLSDTVPGTYSEVIPAIISRVGGSLVQDGASGRLFVSMINNVNLPTVLGGLQGQTTGTYSVSGLAQDIVDYTLEESVVMDTNLLLGTITLSNDGKYRISYGCSMTFPSSITTRTLYFEVYNETTATVVFTYVKNVPRDATADSLHFGAPFSGDANDVYKMRISGDVMDITITGTSFDVESVSIA